MLIIVNAFIMIRFYYEDGITQILIYIYDCAPYVGDGNDEDISEDNDHDIDNAGNDEDENIVPIAMGFYCQVPLHTQSLNREIMFQILPMAITLKLSLMVTSETLFQVRSTCIALFLFIMNLFGGNLPVIVAPLRQYYGEYR